MDLHLPDREPRVQRDATRWRRRRRASSRTPAAWQPTHSSLTRRPQVSRSPARSAGTSTYGTNWSGTMRGTASASGGTIVTGVGVAIENTTTGKWWNGTGFSATSQTSVAASGTTSWTYACRRRPHRRRLLQRHGPGHRLGRQRGYQHPEHLHLQHRGPERSGHLPGQRHHLRDQTGAAPSAARRRPVAGRIVDG